MILSAENPTKDTFGMLLMRGQSKAKLYEFPMRTVKP